jgi:beta-glucosidase
MTKKLTWGAATSSYQIEGAVATDGRKPSIWDTFAHTQGKVFNGENGDIACDHYNRYPEDVAIMKDLGIEAYRFSLAWPRLFPNGDKAREQRGFDFYNRLIDELMNADIKPLITLYHWDLPQPLQDIGGWANRSIVEVFADYAEAAAEAYGDRVTDWITLNEPWCASWLGYGNGVHAPGVRDIDQALAAAHHTALAHAEATRAMKSVNTGIRTGLALNMTNYVIQNPEDREVVELGELMDAHLNRWWIEAQLYGKYPQVLVDEYGDRLARIFKDGDGARLRAAPELLGINYYSDGFLCTPDENSRPSIEGMVFPFNQRVNGNPPGPFTDMGWPITPSGIYDLLMRINKDYPEFEDIAITENGAAFDDGPNEAGEVNDDRRVAYLEEHIHHVLRAVDDGSALKSYFAWSLLDNFEWAEGYQKRFGLVHVDFDSLKRTPKKSAQRYSAIISSDGALISR